MERWMWNHAASMSFTGEQEQKIVANKLNMADRHEQGRHLFEKKTAMPHLHTFHVSPQLSVLLKLSVLFLRLRRVGIAAYPADVYIMWF